MFGGTADRQFFALHSDTGELLWQMRLNGDISGAPVTFEHDGKQYVAVGSGGRAAPTLTLGRLVDIDVPQGTGVMWVFALPDAQARRSPAPRAARRADALRDRRRVYRRASGAGRGGVQLASAAPAIRRASTPARTSRAKWSGQTLADIYQQMSLAMPPANPGGLTPAAYASILAFFLSRSAHPEGAQPLPPDPALLRTIGVRQ